LPAGASCTARPTVPSGFAAQSERAFASVGAGGDRVADLYPAAGRSGRPGRQPGGAGAAGPARAPAVGRAAELRGHGPRCALSRGRRWAVAVRRDRTRGLPARDLDRPPADRAPSA
jgi:hypothetical protein